MNSAEKDGNNNKTPGERVKEERKRRGLTQDALSKIIDVQPNYISMIETGSRPLTVEKAQRIADAFAPIRYQYLLCEDDFKTDSDLTLWNLANEAALRDTLLLGLQSLANSNDYWITTPRLFFEKAKSIGLVFPTEKIMNIPYIVKHNDNLIFLSDKKMESLCKLVADFVRLQFEYLLETEKLLYSDDNPSGEDENKGE